MERDGKVYGGIQEVRGMQTFVMPGMTGDQLEQYLNEISVDVIQSATGQQISGNLAQKIKENESYRFRNVGGNKYSIEFGDRGEAFVLDADGRPVIIDITQLQKSFGLVRPEETTLETPPEETTLETNASLDIYNNPTSETYLIKIKGKIGTFRVKAKDLSAIPETQIGTNVTITEDIDPEKDYKKRSKSALERDFKPMGYERKLVQEKPVEKSELKLQKEKVKEMIDTAPLEIQRATSLKNRKLLDRYREEVSKGIVNDPDFFLSFDDWLKTQ
jgi:hypothetical protein